MMILSHPGYTDDHGRNGAVLLHFFYVNPFVK